MADVGANGLIDLRFSGRERVVGAYLVETSDGLALVDCGSSSTFPTLRDAIAQRGVNLRDIRHLLLTHIHLDHAGAAGSLVREHPDLQVHVSQVGMLHLMYPDVLEHSARSVYGDAFDALWGELVPVPEANLRPVGDQVAGLECFATPGHASHHVVFLHPDGTLYAGDVAGVRIVPGTQVTAPTLPPDVDVALWLASLDAIASRRPARLALTHFGIVDEPERHIRLMRTELKKWLELVRSGLSRDDFILLFDSEVADRGEQIDYHKTMPTAMIYLGLRQYADRERG